MSKLHDAVAPLAAEMMQTGRVPGDAKERLVASYGEPIGALRVHWAADRDRTGASVVAWRATADHDFVTGYADEIDVYLAREAAEDQ